jgi:hypothetical protein
VRWTGSDVKGALPEATTDIVSFPMSGATKGRAELEYRVVGLVDSIAFGKAGTGLAGLLLASSNTPQRPTAANGSTAVAHSSAVWAIELKSRRALKLAEGGTRGESIVATADVQPPCWSRRPTASTNWRPSRRPRSSPPASPMARWCRCR